MVFAPSELATGNMLYIVWRGNAIYGGRLLRAGGVWGDDVLLRSEKLCARAISLKVERECVQPRALGVSEYRPAVRLRLWCCLPCRFVFCVSCGLGFAHVPTFLLLLFQGKTRFVSIFYRKF